MPHEFTAPGTVTTADLDALDGTPTEADAELDDLRAGGASSELDDLDAELTPVLDKPAVLEVLSRPGYAIRCRTDFTGQDLELLRKKSRDKKYAAGIDGIKFSSLLLALTTTAILRKGEPLELDGVSPVTFSTKELQARMGTATAAETVRVFLGGDGRVENTSARLMDEAGWGDEVYAVEDPTA